ncbi:MAG: hypothetical protein JWN88_981 [Frankiales bacterium]|jgi:hypothetical protein|nr:hypothetical protein [Frankiales bacterium]
MSETLSSHDSPTTQDRPGGGMKARLAVAWAFVGVPLAYGVFETAKKAAALFTG